MSDTGFSASKDYFGGPDGLAVYGSSDGKSAQVVTSPNEDGDIVAQNVYGEVSAPSSDYKVIAEVTTLPALGSVAADGERKVMVEKITITTAAGAEPTVNISGKEVESTATTKRSFVFGPSANEITLSPRHRAQVLMEAFTLQSPTGLNVTKFDLELSSTVSVSTIKGAPQYSDCFEGVAKAKATVMQTGASAPTVTPGTGWVLTSPPASTSPDAAYVEWTFELTKPLTVTEAA